MSDQIASTPLHGPTTYDFGEATPKEWPQGEYVPKSVYDILAASVDRLTSDKARLAVELAAEQESNTFLNNLHTVDQDRLRALEAENVRLNMEMVAYRQKLTPKDIEAMTAVIAALQAEKAARAVPETGTERGK